MHTTSEKIRKQMGLWYADVVWEDAFQFDMMYQEQVKKGEAIFPRLDIEKELDQRFYRCHRSYLVNTDNIAEIDYGQLMIRMKNGEICPVATRKKRGLKNRMS